MSTGTLERIIEEVKELSVEDRRQLTAYLNDEARSREQGERDKLASGIRGKYKAVLSSSEEFARQKAGEIELEERR